MVSLLFSALHVITELSHLFFCLVVMLVCAVFALNFAKPVQCVGDQ
ncbi:hypothetical protein X975_17757, partial [Stegodyphus mimosarum]